MTARPPSQLAATVRGAIADCHNLLRPLLEREALAGPDTPDHFEGHIGANLAGLDTPADSQEDKT